VFPLRKFYTEQMFILVRNVIMQPCIHTNSKAFQALQGLCNIYDIKFGLLLVCENKISLRKWSVRTAHLRTLEGKLVRNH